MVVDNTYPDVRVERQARALVERGYAVDVICQGGMGQPDTERLDGVTVRRLRGARRRGASLPVQLWEYLTFLLRATATVAARHSRRRYDSVQVHNVPDFLVFSALVPKLSGARVILDLHDLMPEFYASRFGSGMNALPVRAVRVQERLSGAFADHVLTVSELWRRALIERGFAPEKVSVVMNLPDEAIFRPQAPRVREDAAGGLCVIYHGTLTHRYGLDLLLRALAVARARTPLRLLLHGRGEYQEDLRRLADELGLGDAVEFSTQELPTEALPDLLCQADIGVVPYRNDLFTDGIVPTKLLEYATLGIPSIVSRSRAVEEYFTDEMVRFVEPGSVPELADALTELAGDPARRLSLATAAGRFVKAHRWRDEADRYAALVRGDLATDGTTDQRSEVHP
jgi:glycosyltransferase involved in cell wall biosynthesis